MTPHIISSQGCLLACLATGVICAVISFAFTMIFSNGRLAKYQREYSDELQGMEKENERLSKACNSALSEANSEADNAAELRQALNAEQESHIAADERTVALGIQLRDANEKIASLTERNAVLDLDLTEAQNALRMLTKIEEATTKKAKKSGKKKAGKK